MNDRELLCVMAAQIEAGDISSANGDPNRRIMSDTDVIDRAIAVMREVDSRMDRDQCLPDLEENGQDPPPPTLSVPAHLYGSEGIRPAPGRCPLNEDVSCVSGSGGSCCGSFEGAYLNKATDSLYVSCNSGSLEIHSPG